MIVNVCPAAIPVVGSETVCAVEPVNTCTCLSVILSDIGVEDVTVVAGTGMKISADKLLLESNCAKTLAAGVVPTPVPVAVPLMTGVVSVGVLSVGVVS